MGVMDREQRLKEITEAISAGNLTLEYLNEAKATLTSASNFGLADLFGLDLIGGIGKHMKLTQAKELMEKAKMQVLLFQKELRDVSATLEFSVNIGEFLTLADFFFDGLIADLFVQSRIGDAKDQVDRASRQIQIILSDLYRIQSEIL